MELIYPNALDDVIHSITSSELNTRYIQPVKQLAEHVFSHAIEPELWLKIYQRYTSRCSPLKPKVYLQTVYHDNDRVLINQQTELNEKVYHQIHHRNDHLFIPDYDQEEEVNLEYVGGNRINLAIDNFPIQKEYSHERQSIVYVIEAPDEAYYMEMEILIPGIQSYAQRKSLIKTPVNQIVYDDQAFSLSYRLFLNRRIHKDELQSLLDELKP